MPDDEGMGIGIDAGKIMQELMIKPDRIPEILKILEASKSDPNALESINRFIASTTKANELAFLCFIRGMIEGTTFMVKSLGDNDKIQKAMISAAAYGATHPQEVIDRLPEEIKAAIAAKDPTATIPDGKKQEKKPEDVMYG